ncbi:hypothetical protein M409DRAFT_25181 [Zasmidium cellare ATCC 36951]|uniref:Nitroreductase domain-containing protein n=1 Tax=Zasmidium cellare ATCC 36951 TaxID=1080233 RepID=A0A6A6CEF2_ZASCE|nr:uncharacterized protein M409DRAFT_25181 [Zasmidium cellare ATCC 36951]KAF2164302.1 hypothetical protein M409DRAFT_25181 [Zasmidium cellare ATCC 36951]
MAAPASADKPSIDSIIRNRHSTRSFRPDPVPRTLLQECLLLAQRGAASNSNIQNWRLTLATGPARERIVKALVHASQTSIPLAHPLPAQFRHHRDNLVQQLYGAQGYDVMGEEKRDARQEARMKNYSFFGAPVVGVISMDEELKEVDALAVGLFIQNFILLLSARSLGSCLQVSVTSYPEVLRREFNLPDGRKILCGIAIGWPGEERINSVVSEREAIERQVEFLEE